MKVIANGRERPVDPEWTVAEFIESLGLDPRFVIVELNGEALERGRFPGVGLADGDHIEVVRAVAGG